MFNNWQVLGIYQRFKTHKTSFEILPHVLVIIMAKVKGKGLTLGISQTKLFDQPGPGLFSYEII